MRAMEDYIDTDGYDPNNPQPLVSSRARSRKAADAEEDVDYEALPRVDDLDGFNRAVNMADMIRIEPDILEWLISHGLDYEMRANAILRRAMILERGLTPPNVFFPGEGGG